MLLGRCVQTAAGDHDVALVSVNRQSASIVNRQSTIVNRLAGRQFVVLVASSWLRRPQTRSVCSLGRWEKEEGRKEKGEEFSHFLLLFRREQLTQFDFWHRGLSMERTLNQSICVCLTLQRLTRHCRVFPPCVVSCQPHVTGRPSLVYSLTRD